MEEVRKPAGIIYEALIPKLSWWQAKDGREFLVVERLCEIRPEKEDPTWEIYRIGLLEKYKSEPVYQPWEEFCRWVDKGMMKRINK